MRFAFMFRALTRVGLAALLMLAVAARAHGPFDHSTRLLVGESRLEVIVTMGADATREFLTRAGVAPGASAQSTRELPAALAAKLFTIHADGQALAAGNIRVVTEGLETIFTTAFPRPEGDALELRALFFQRHRADEARGVRGGGWEPASARRGGVVVAGE